MTYDAYSPRRPKGKAAAAGEMVDEDVGVAAERARKAQAREPDSNLVARDQLRAFIERIERLEEEKKTLSADIKDIYAEAKGTGFDTKALRRVIAIRKTDADQWREQEAILDTYLAALGMLPEGEL